MTARKPRKPKVLGYSKTQAGQLVHDLGFTKLSAKYLARKHKMPISNVRDMRAIVLAALGKPVPRKKGGRT